MLLTRNKVEGSGAAVGEPALTRLVSDSVAVQSRTKGLITAAGGVEAKVVIVIGAEDVPEISR